MKQTLLHQVTPNEILLPIDSNAAGVPILREFKTQDGMHLVLYTRSLGNELTKELRASLEADPRFYLFTESNSTRQYTHTVHLPCMQGIPCTSYLESLAL